VIVGVSPSAAEAHQDEASGKVPGLQALREPL
jgi:hypothetical protein